MLENQCGILVKVLVKKLGDPLVYSDARHESQLNGPVAPSEPNLLRKVMVGKIHGGSLNYVVVIVVL